ncbi:hypothetical protein [uncultured Clostridium sp.]|uniref:hypothetical protein n=1 Tax=uncultured Clostridium sp. TaxID=59620 RepID=UPI00263B1B8C|nr:hypothetical protein [uncultured Clostridium sp.]
MKYNKGEFYSEGKSSLKTKVLPNEDYYNNLGVIDYGDLQAFDYFESGHVFLAVLTMPRIHEAYHNQQSGPGKESTMKRNISFENLQILFSNIITHDFKGLSGIDDITSETLDIADNIAGTRSSISQTNKPLTSEISMRFTEKGALPITTYLDRYLSYVSDPYTHLKNYSGMTEANTNSKYLGFHRECFTLLYIVTDATCMHIEKAFLLVNAQPRTASLSELFDAEKGENQQKEITINWTCSVLTGAKVNDAAAAYVKEALTRDTGNGKRISILNSWDYNWTISSDPITSLDDLEMNL